MKVEIRIQNAASIDELTATRLGGFGWRAAGAPHRLEAGRWQLKAESCYNALLMISARAILAGVFGAIFALVLAAPLMAHWGTSAAALAYLFFFSICHQRPERSFTLWGHPLAVCQRCTGIYLGAFLGALVKNDFMHRSPAIRRLWVLAGMVPLLLDWILQSIGVWKGTGLIRFSTGLIFGVTAGWLVVRGAEELFRKPLLWRRL